MVKRLILTGLVLGSCAVPVGIAFAGQTPRSAAPLAQKPLSNKVVWYVDVIKANPIADAIAQGINQSIVKAGGSIVRSFDFNSQTNAIDPALQAQAFQRAITQKVSAIVYFVLDPTAPRPQVQAAMKAGIPVFAVGGVPKGFKVSAYTKQNDCALGAVPARYLASRLPKSAKVTTIGGPSTPATLTEMACAEKALKAAGMTYVGDPKQQQNLTDTAPGGQQIMQAILQKYPDIQGVFAENDDTALGAAAAAKAAGKHVLIMGRNGEPAAVAAVKAGTLVGTCDYNPVKLGEIIGTAVVKQLSGKARYKNNHAIPGPLAAKCLVTKKTASRWVPWNKRVKYVALKEG